MKTLIFIVIWVFVVFPSRSQNEKLEEIITSLQTYYQYNPSEKVYLSTNKEVFKPGETVWFSALISCYTNPGVKDISKDLTIRLYDSDGILFMSDSFKIEDGKSSGDIKLPLSLTQGNYFLTAHTRLANNEDDVYLKMIIIDPKDEDRIQAEQVEIPDLLKAGENNELEFFLKDLSGKSATPGKINYELYEKDKRIDSGRLKAEKDGSLQVNLNLSDKTYNTPLLFLMFDKKRNLNYKRVFQVDTETLNVKFLAEGGSFVAGKAQKIGFIVTNGIGQPVEIEGKLTDEGNEAITQTRTMVPGYGMFPFLGAESKKYKLQLTSELGKGQSFELPEFKNEGLCLRIQKTGDDFIHLGFMYADNARHKAYLLITKGGFVSWASEINIEGSLSLKLPKENFPADLSLISVFDENGKLLAKRTVYVDKGQTLNLQLETADEQIISGEPFDFKVNLLTKDSTAIPGNLTIAVSALNEMIHGANELESCFKLNNELGNKIPVVQLSEKKENRTNSLNYLLISSDFKNFSWAEILDFDEEKSKRPQHGIGGYVYGTDKNPVQNAKVSLVNRQNLQILTKSSNEDGYFFFPGLNPEKIPDHVVKAIGIDGNKNLKIEFEKDFDTKLSEHVSKISAILAGAEKPFVSKDYFEANRQLYQRIKKTRFVKEREPAYKAALKTATNLIDVIKQIKPFEMLSNNKDGSRIPADFMESRAESANKLNTALYWNPSIDLDPSGPLEIEVPTSDIVGTFLIQAEAIDSKGRIGTASKIVEVIKR